MSLSEEISADPPFTGRTEWMSFELEGGGSMPAFLAQPAGAAVGVVLLAHDIFGMRAFYEGLARRLATAGLVALVPDFFFRQGRVPDASLEAAIARRTQLDERRTLEDLSAALAWLRKHPACRGKVGTMGFCMGGTFALNLCARAADLVTVSFYGFPVPQANLAKPPPRPLDLIPAMRGPILAIWGEHDEYVGMEHVHAFARRAAEAGIDMDVQILTGLGHSYFTANTAVDATAEQRARDSWDQAVRFLQRHLAGA